MSNDKDSKEPGPDDDGWGDAGNEGATPDPEVTPPDAEWVDPANLEERVAALRERRDQPTAPKVVVEPPPETNELAGNTTGPILTLGATTEVGGDAATAITDDDAPQWSPDDQELPPPSSDMLAAAGVLAQKEDEPAAKKRRKLKKRKEKDPRTQLTRRQQLVLVGGAALLVATAACAVLGWLNNQRYYLVCGTRSITAEQGSFWPWGQDSLGGEAFKAIEGDHPCTSREFDNRNDLEEAFLVALIEQATRLLASGDADHVTAAKQELQQALLLSRDPERGKQRAMVERLQGDVAYWRGAAEIQRALKILSTGASYFEDAATRRPRHSNDANAWAEHARFIGSEIDKGPKPLRKDESPKEEPHFQGLSEPDAETPAAADPSTEPPAATPAEGSESGVDAPIDAGVAPTQPEPSAADAALPKGGVLL